METVNKYVTAASTAIWGQDGTQAVDQHEPLSGIQGKGEPTDPYDAGNRDEQPGAPKSDSNTATQEPNLGGRTQTYEEAALTSNPVLTKPVAATIDTEDSSFVATPATTAASTAQPISSGSTGSKEQKEQHETTPEQRDTSQTEGESSETHRPAHLEPSIEALEGPQGPPLKPAEEFEKEAKGMRFAKNNTEENSTGGFKNGAADADESPVSSNKSEHSQDNGKSSKLSKVKASVKKHLHHSNT